MPFVEEIRESEIREIFHFWCNCRKGARVPERSAIDPSKIPHRLLPHMFLFTHEKDGRFLCRLIGTALVRTYGKDHTGHYLEDILPPDAAQHRQSLYGQILGSGYPAYVRGIAIVKMGEQRQCGRVLLPLSSKSGKKADQILGLVRFGPRERPVPDPIAMRALANPRHIRFATTEELESGGTAKSEVETRVRVD